MARIIAYLWRFIWIAGAVVAAILTGLVIYFTTTRVAMGELPDFAIFASQVGSHVMVLLGDRPVHVPLALGIVAAAVGIMEYNGARGGITYGIAAAGCVALTIFIIVEVPVLMMGNSVAMAVQAVLSAFIAGMVYWVLAGRTAGRWRI